MPPPPSPASSAYARRASISATRRSSRASPRSTGRRACRSSRAARWSKRCRLAASSGSMAATTRIAASHSPAWPPTGPRSRHLCRSISCSACSPPRTRRASCGRWRVMRGAPAPYRFPRATAPIRPRRPAPGRPTSASIACPQTISARRWRTCWPPSPRRCAFSSVDRSTSPARCLPATAEALRDRCIDPAHQLLLGLGADLGGGDLAVLEQQQGGDRADAVARRRHRVLVDIDLHHLELAAHVLGDLLERGADHAAGAAPFGPEVDEDGRIGFQDFLLEGSVGRFDGHGTLPKTDRAGRWTGAALAQKLGTSAPRVKVCPGIAGRKALIY